MARRQTEALSRELAERRFARLYAATRADLLAYALRRTSAEDAADLVAETFLVAWRRLHEVPAGEDARLWLYAVARWTLANQRRGEARRERLAERLRQELRTQVIASPPDSEAADALRLLAGLKEEDREILMLVAWEGLAAGEAAPVLGISTIAARTRLHRARRRFRQALEADRSRLEGMVGRVRCEEAR